MKYLLLLLAFALPAQAQEARHLQDRYFYIIKTMPDPLQLGTEADYGKRAYRDLVWGESGRLSTECQVRVDVWTTDLITDRTEVWEPRKLIAFIAMADTPEEAQQAAEGIDCAKGGYVKRGTITIPASFRYCAGPDDGSEKYAGLCN